MPTVNEKVLKKIEKKVSNKKDSHKMKKAERIDVSYFEGLSLEQVEDRKKNNLVNKKNLDNTKSYFKIFMNNICSFCNLLTIGLVVLLICIGAWDYTISSCIIFINIGIGIYQEIKAKKAVQKLTLLTQSSYEVIRQSMQYTISTDEIVLDDVIIIRAGQQIPIDGSILQGTLEVDESILTGENIPVKKELSDKLLSGSSVVSGEAIVRAERVGKDCYIEGITKIAQKISKPKSDIFKTLNELIKGLSAILVVLATLLLIAERVSTVSTWKDTIISVSSSMLGMIPVGMFLLTSTALASSVLRLSKKNALPQDLYSIEMLARVDTLLLDKTGTITDGKLEVTERFDISKPDINIEDIILTLDNENKDKKPTAQALNNYSKDGKVLQAKQALAFNSIRKYSAVTIEDKTYLLGAPDIICPNDEKVSAYCDLQSLKGRRTILLAECDFTIDDINLDRTRPIAIFALEEKIKDDVKETLKWFHDNDVDIKIISGDNPQTVSTIAQKSGVYNAEKYVNCSNISNEDLNNLTESAAVFGRVSPEQKLRIVQDLQKKGHIVGMMGDGVNDVQSLKESDCSISFANANDAARNISRIVLLDNNFKSMPHIVEEGRRVIANVEKVSSLYIMKNLFVMFMTIVYAIMTIVNKTQSYPFDTKKMLLIEFFVIGVPTFCYALLPNTARIKGNFLRNILKSSIPSAISLIVSTGFILIISGSLDYTGIENISNYQISMATFALTMAGFFAVLVISMPPNKIRLSILGAMIVLSILAVLVDGVLPGELKGMFFDMQIITKHAVWIVLSTCIAAIINLTVKYISDKIDKKYGEKITDSYHNFVDKVKYSINKLLPKH